MSPRPGTSDETVVLLHGLWLNGVAMQPLRRRLRRQHGFSVQIYSYPSVTRGLADNIRRLAEYLRRIRASRLHLVGHSLGGVLALHTLTLLEGAAPGRVVCIGSPLRSSQAARALAGWHGGPRLLGQLVQDTLFDDPLEAYAGPREVGVIAGDFGVGIGLVLDRLARPNDGTVTVAETQLPGIADHLVLPVSHTAMLVSRQVADQAAHFLQHGVFLRHDCH